MSGKQYIEKKILAQIPINELYLPCYMQLSTYSVQKCPLHYFPSGSCMSADQNKCYHILLFVYICEYRIIWMVPSLSLEWLLDFLCLHSKKSSHHLLKPQY